jgi:glyceraldehyde 3-phosphate dehydrogenase
MKRIAINGFGKIGRAALKVVLDTPGLELIAFNDLMSVENAAYLLRHDNVYGKYPGTVAVLGQNLFVNNHDIH